jgi:hypothetical protein
MRIVGINLGAKCGIAYRHSDKDWNFETIGPFELISNYWVDGIYVIEDATLQSHVFHSCKNKDAALKIARNTGEVDAYCKLIAQKLERSGHQVIRVSSKNKGQKLNAAQFEAATGYKGQTNQHERDAGMLAWKYRNWSDK